MKKLLSISIASTMLASTFYLTSNAHASGFAIIENSASGMGQAFAGAAAVAEDPSTIYFNPAGMTYLEGTQVTTGLHIIDSSAKFKNNGSTPVGGDEGGNAGDTFYVPNFYYVQDFAEKFKFGLGVNAPFGLGTTYKSNWMGRYTSTDSELKSININPSIAFRSSEQLSIGLGFNIQYMESTLKSNIYQAALGMSDGKANITGDSWAFGMNAGIIYEITPATRLGVHYRSRVSHTLKGDAKFTNMHPLLGGDKKIDARADIDTPATFSISLSHQVNNSLTLLADVTHTQWSNFEELRVIADDSGATISVVEENWGDSYRASFGVKYQLSEQWILRTGIAHDQTPISDRYRTSRIPGDDRNWLSFGASFMPNNDLTIDVGYSHLWVEDAKIDEDYRLLSGSGKLVGEFDSDVDILSVQATMKF